jgi:hypothetical protein
VICEELGLLELAIPVAVLEAEDAAAAGLCDQLGV